MKNSKFLDEDMADAIEKLKAMGRDVTPDTITRRDLVDLTKAKANWNMDNDEMNVVNNNTIDARDAATMPNRPSAAATMPDALPVPTDAEDTQVDGSSTTAMVSALQNKKDELADSIAMALAPELANAEPELKQKIAQAIEAALLGN